MYQIEEFPELWADACLRSSEGRMMFLSLYGRDGSIMQFLSALELGRERGVDRFHLKCDGQRHPVDVNDTERLCKHSTHLPRYCLFGSLTQTWLYDKSLQEPDRVNRIAWVMQHEQDSTMLSTSILEDKVWLAMLDLSPVALLDHWRKPLMQWCQDKRAVELLDDPIYPTLGPIKAMRVSLSDHFVSFVSESVRNGLLTAS